MVLAGIARVGQRSAWAEMLTPTRTGLGCGTGDLVGNGAGISGVLAGVREAALDEWGRSCEDRLELACSGRDSGADGLGLMGRYFREWQRCKANRLGLEAAVNLLGTAGCVLSKGRVAETNRLGLEQGAEVQGPTGWRWEIVRGSTGWDLSAGSRGHQTGA